MPGPVTAGLSIQPSILGGTHGRPDDLPFGGMEVLARFSMPDSIQFHRYSAI